MPIDIIVPQSISFRDAKGFIGTVRWHVAADSSVSTHLSDISNIGTAMQSAIEALTNAAFQGGSYPYSAVTLAYGTAAAYAAEWQKAVMTFTTDTAQITRFKIPAPKLAILEADEVTVINDGTNAAVVAWVAAVKTAINSAFVSTKGGLPFTHFVGGVVRLGKQPRRHNEFIKSAKLVAGEGE